MVGKALGVETNLTTAQLKLADEAMAKLVGEGKPEQAAEMYEALAAKTNGSKDALDKLNGLLPEYEAAQEGASTATEATAEQVDTFTESTESAQESLDSFIESLRGLGDTQLSLNDANRQVQESLDSFQASVEENGKTLDITTEAGRANSSALDGIASSYLEAAAAAVEHTGKEADAIPVIQAGRDAIIAAGEAAGLSADEAAAYADELGLIPKNVKTAIDANWAEAISQANAVARAIRDIPGYRAVIIDQVVKQTGAARGEVGAAFNANGGMYSYANGGFGSGFYSGGTPLYKFAEPETRWEAFISGKPGQEERNRGIAMEAYQRLGGEMPTPSFDGMSITGRLEIGGDGLGRIIDGRIVSAGRSQRMSLENGSRR